MFARSFDAVTLMNHAITYVRVRRTGVRWGGSFAYCWMVTIGCDAASTASASSAVNCSVFAE